MSDTAALSVEHLTKSFGPLRALDDVSLTVDQGAFFALLGPNGAGKSTLINALAGLVVPDAGRIEILGRGISEDPRWCRMALGIVPQEITFDPFFTVRETLRHQSGYYGLSKNKAWIETLLERLELTDKADTRVSRLSGGMKRRVLVAQALVHRPPIIVLDEPTAGVDIDLRMRLWAFMRELNAEGHTIILTTHYLEEAQNLCSRTALLNHGKIVAFDDTKALLTRFSGNRLFFRVIKGSLQALEGFRFEEHDEGVVSVALRSPGSLQATLAALSEAGVSVDIVRVGEANLEEVFVRLTQES